MLTATYHLRCASPDEASALASAIAREQTLEVPAGVGGDALQAALLGRIEGVEHRAEGGYVATIAYPAEVTGTDLLQVVNVAYGNVSLMNGVRLVGLNLPAEVLDASPGPRFGIGGLRGLAGVEVGRPLVAVALKPVGLTAAELAELATTFARAGVDVIKDDHGLVDQPSAPFRERVERVSRAIAASNSETGSKSVYFPNVTGPSDTLAARLAHVEACGCQGVLVCPSLMGLDTVRGIASAETELAIMAHPAHGQSAPDRAEGMAPEVLYGTLYRVAGADAVVYVNAQGRFAWPLEACEAINAHLRGPLGHLRPAMPTPAGGVDAAQAARWFRRYGPDTMLLIGGSLLAQDDVLAATRRVVEAAAAASPTGDGP